MNLLLCLASFISLVFAGDVLEYSFSDFKSKIATHDLAMVKFFSPWDARSLQHGPEYEKAATILKDNDPPVHLIEVDCTTSTGICVQYGAQVYPVLKLVRNGEVAEDYTGRADGDGIAKYMRYSAGPASKEMKTVEDVEKFLSHEEYSVIGFFRNGESELAKTYQKVADALRTEMMFGHATEQAVRDKYSYNDAIVLFQPKKYHSQYEEPANIYNDDVSVQKIKTWIQKQSLGLCSERTDENAEKFMKPLVVVYYDVDYSKNVKVTNYWRNRVVKVAKTFHDAGKEVHFAIGNQKKWYHELGTFGLVEVKKDTPGETPRPMPVPTTSDKPVVTARDTRERKFVMSDEFSVENLEKFVKDLLDDKLEPYLKSEPVPSSNDEPVKVAVAKNFDEIVNNDDKDVLIEFYAPWCKRCQSFEPIYKELAEKLKDESEVTIAKMDVTVNELPKPYTFSDFPMIYFAPKGNKKTPKKYSGGLEVDELLKFIAKESTHGLMGFNRSEKKKKTEL